MAGVRCLNCTLVGILYHGMCSWGIARQLETAQTVITDAARELLRARG